MYNWINDLNIIYKKLEIENRFDIKEEIFEAQLSGGTGGEIFLLVTEKLLKIKENNLIIYTLLEEQINNIINYGYSNGFLRK